MRIPSLAMPSHPSQSSPRRKSWPNLLRTLHGPSSSSFLTLRTRTRRACVPADNSPQRFEILMSSLPLTSGQWLISERTVTPSRYFSFSSPAVLPLLLLLLPFDSELHHSGARPWSLWRLQSRRVREAAELGLREGLPQEGPALQGARR